MTANSESLISGQLNKPGIKCVILAGGLGTRLSEETHLKPKPMVEIGGKPILWHIMKLYSHYGISDFIVCAGYKGYVIKEYFANYSLHTSDVTFDMSRNLVEVHTRKTEPWRVTVVDTGDETMTGGRLARVKPFLNDESFCFTYGDGLADINIRSLISAHQSAGTIATMTAVQPPGRYGAVGFSATSKHLISNFQEKPEGDGAWINGGFFVLQPQCIDFITDGDQTVWEGKPLQSLAAEGQLNAFRHSGFWRPMDTLRDKMELEGLWKNQKAPWKVWT